MNFEIILTADGSSTILIPELKEHYHSIHGAIQEANHVFIEAGLKALPKNSLPVNILEVGFGTGLNCFLTFLNAALFKSGIHYTAIEAYPLGMEIISKLNYSKQLNQEKSFDIFNSLHESCWGIKNIITETFQLNKQHLKIADFEPPNNFFDLIYFDAFGPPVQPEMWGAEIFQKMYLALKPGGVLVTYCAKGEVKRNLKASGFKVESLPGPPGKREMTRAWK